MFGSLIRSSVERARAGSRNLSKKNGPAKPRPMKCEGNVYLQRGTADAAALGGSRHAHQLRTICPIFDQSGNIYCATQLCECCGAYKLPPTLGRLVNCCIVARRIGQVVIDLLQLATLVLELVGEGEGAAVSCSVGNQPSTGFL